MATDLSYIARANDWAVTAAYSATSTQSGSSPANAGTDDPAVKWTANSGTATLTADLAGSKSVNQIGLTGTNADIGKVITIAGGVTGSPTLVANGQDLILTLNPAQTLTQVTFAITGNSVNWSVGRAVIGSSTTIPNFLDGFSATPFRQQYTDINDFGHDLRYDLGVKLWKIQGDLVLTAANQAALDAIWDATMAGFYPTTFYVGSPYPPWFMRFPSELPRKHDNKHLRVTLAMQTLCPGLSPV